MELGEYQELPLKQQHEALNEMPLSQLEGMIQALLSHNEETNKKIGELAAHSIDASWKTMKRFYHNIDKIKEAVDNRDFTTTFEYVMKLKLELTASTEIQPMVRNHDMHTFLTIYSNRLCKMCFAHLEKMEANTKMDNFLKIN